MKRLILLLLTLFSFIKFNAQTKFEKLNTNKGYPYINVEILTDSVNFGLIESLYVTKDSLNKNKFINIGWNSSCTDGSYNLVITPEQVYLRDSHENPNPDNLIWIIEISQTTYKDIQNNLNKNELNKLIQKITEQEKIDNLKLSCNEILEKQYEIIIDFINEYISIDKIKLELKREPKNQIYFGWSKEDIENSIPKIIHQ